MLRRPPSSTRTATLLPYTTLSRSTPAVGSPDPVRPTVACPRPPPTKPLRPAYLEGTDTPPEGESAAMALPSTMRAGAVLDVHAMNRLGSMRERDAKIGRAHV